MNNAEDAPTASITGKCYCGATSFRSSQPPQTVAYCHCNDCRRSTVAPVAAFAAFDEGTVTFTPSDGQKITANPGVTRSFCPECGSALTGRFDYLPGQVYVPVGILDQADAFPPRLHAHEENCLSWLRIEDDLPRIEGTSRNRLSEKAR